MNKNILLELSLIGCNIKQNEPLSKHTTLCIGGNADYFVEVETEQQLVSLLKFINENNNVIKQSRHDGIVVRSIEESSYYFHFYKYENLTKEYDRLFNESNNIKVDCVIYLDADYQTLCDRCEKDNGRDMTETRSWYEYEYNRYVDYWTQYPGVKKIDTKDKKIGEIYNELLLTLSKI